MSSPSLNRALVPGTLGTMDFEWAMAEMRSGGWVTQSSNEDPQYRMTFAETDERLQQIVEAVKADGDFPELVLEFEGPVFVERSGKADICLAGDIWVAAVLADDWEKWEGDESDADST
jgi:hypothetical protein